jgi:hypothetical protein
VLSAPKGNTKAAHAGMTLARVRSMLKIMRPTVRMRLERAWVSPPTLGNPEVGRLF